MGLAEVEIVKSDIDGINPERNETMMPDVENPTAVPNVENPTASSGEEYSKFSLEEVSNLQ
jgi:hypothetical protein